MASLENVLALLRGEAAEESGTQFDVSNLTFSTILDSSRSDFASLVEEPNRWLVDDTLEFDPGFGSEQMSTPRPQGGYVTWKEHPPAETLPGPLNHDVDLETTHSVVNQEQVPAPLTDEFDNGFPEWCLNLGSDSGLESETEGIAGPVKPAHLTSPTPSSSSTLNEIGDLDAKEVVPDYMSSMNILKRVGTNSRLTAAQRTARSKDRKRAHEDMGQHALSLLRTSVPVDDDAFAALDGVDAKRIILGLMRVTRSYNEFERTIRISAGPGTVPYTFQGVKSSSLYLDKIFFPPWMTVGDWVEGSKREDTREAKRLRLMEPKHQ